MFNLGFSELLLLGAIALIFIGPKQLPEVARTIGRFLNELKRASADFQATLTDGMKEDLSKRVTDSRKNHQEPSPSDEAHKIAPHDMGPEAIVVPLDQPKPVEPTEPVVAGESKDSKHES